MECECWALVEYESGSWGNANVEHWGNMSVEHRLNVSVEHW